MEKFDLGKHWGKFLSDKLAVNCPTKELADEFFTYCKESSLIWAGGTPLLETNWEVYEEDTCYFCSNNWISYGSLSVEKNQVIVEFKGFENMRLRKDEVKMEDIIKEGYVLYHKPSQKYCDSYSEQTNEMSDIEVYETEEETRELFDSIDEPDNFTIRQVKIKVEVLKEYQRKVTFEEVVK